MKLKYSQEYSSHKTSYFLPPYNSLLKIFERLAWKIANSIQDKNKTICYSHTIAKLKIYLFECFVVNCPTKLGIMGNCVQVFGLWSVSEFEHAYVVITGHQQCIVGSWLHVHGEGAMFRHSAMDTAGKFEHHCLKARVFLDVPHFDHLLHKNIHC